MPYFILILVSVAVLAYRNLRKKVTAHVPKTFPTAAFRQNIIDKKPIVACFGDSNTHGNVSYDWVADLAKMYPHFQFVNAGRNSDLTFTLLHRIDDLIACKPAFINLLIGTNDINATLAASSMKRYRENGRLREGELPSIVSFGRNYEEIVLRLTSETTAKIAVMSLPLMGEDPESEINETVAAYNGIINEVAVRHNLTYLPLFEEQKAYLQQNPSQTKYTFSRYFYLLNLSVVKHYWFGKTWDEISKSHGTRLSPDFLHQNSVSGKMITGLVSRFISNNSK